MKNFLDRANQMVDEANISIKEYNQMIKDYEKKGFFGKMFSADPASHEAQIRSKKGVIESINEKKIGTYTTQLQSYALMMQKPRKDSLKLDPIKKLGIFCFDPSNISPTNGKDCSIYMNTKWFEIKRDDKSLIKYISGILEVLSSKEAPKENPSCGICNFRKK